MAEAPEAKSGTELVSRIRAGDQRADEELIQRYGRGVSFIISRAVGDRFVTEDLCQETFRIALEKIKQGDVREPEKLPGFICHLAKNLVTDHFRRLHPERYEDIEKAMPLPDPRPSPLDQLLQKEKAAIVRQVLDELKSDRDREVLFRFYIAGDEKEWICADLGLTRLHFNRVLFRARQRYNTTVLQNH